MKKPMLSVLLILSAAALWATGDRYIEVSGTGTAVVRSDYILISFSIVTKDNDFSRAQQKNAQIAERVFTLLKNDYGIPEADITTLAYGLQKTYRYTPNEGQREDGYEARNSLQAKLKRMDRYKSLLTDLLSAGVDNIGGVSFGVENLEGPRLAALEKALLAARAKAEILAAATGQRLGPPLVIHEKILQDPARPVELRNTYATAEAVGGNGESIVSEGTRIIEAGITIRYELGN